MRNCIPFLLFIIGSLIPFSADPAELDNTQVWGFFGHRLINRLAIYTLPDELFRFYKKHQQYLEEHSVDPDKRRYAVKGEAECHFIDLDQYGNHPDSIRAYLPQRWNDAISKFGEPWLREHGIGPWNTYRVYLNLQQAFEKGEEAQILKYSAELGHYIGDMHVPLHTTHNYNGQLTGQHGIHGLWESRLPELFSTEYRLNAAKATYLERPLESIWKVVFQSNSYLPLVFGSEDSLSWQLSNEKYAFESRGTMVQKVYSREFSRAYQKAMGNMVEQRMRCAIELLGCIIYTAWVNAGQPDLSTVVSRKVENLSADSLLPEDKALKVRDHE